MTLLSENYPIYLRLAVRGDPFGIALMICSTLEIDRCTSVVLALILAIWVFDLMPCSAFLKAIFMSSYMTTRLESSSAVLSAACAYLDPQPAFTHLPNHPNPSDYSLSVVSRTDPIISHPAASGRRCNSLSSSQILCCPCERVSVSIQIAQCGCVSREADLSPCQ